MTRKCHYCKREITVQESVSWCQEDPCQEADCLRAVCEDPECVERMMDGFKAKARKAMGK
jgi:hypothetical protein